MNSNTHSESLIEAREILEVTAVQMAAERRSLENLDSIKLAQDAFCEQTLDQLDAIEEDLLFHLEVVSAGKNNVLKSLYLKIFPDLLELLASIKRRGKKESFAAITEHDNIIEHISKQDKERAATAMKVHLRNDY
ncbi:MAG: FCD domain-containing protein [Bacteroidota bacterium]